ncbi:family 43 glycosylhydrolase [Cellulomonas sp. KRMCY2]|uniref:family 43 glycosylhydrolase n=1 Tax=Cellulomonas sp. KRMCY2 TaxID=1304865 RepID=UPI0018CC640D|nr:family 43 glycosylhydrolase [Cellulomonas sp. KRMCY2]
MEDGAADPTLVWNPHESAWWMVYTARRVGSAENGVGWVHGTGLGVASSADDGTTWTYRGQLSGLETEWGHNTFWAPEILEVDGVFHMYVTYIRGVPTVWAGHPRTIRHYTSPDLVRWTFRSTVPLSSTRVIDACVFPLPGGGYRLWYKDEADGNTIWAADSPDLAEWHVIGAVLRTDVAHEGPNVFRLGDRYWMVVDAKCQLVYRSDDLEHWEYAGTVLDAASGRAGGRTDDLGPGLHGDVVVGGETAWIYYFTHPDRHRPDFVSGNPRRSSIQVAQLRVEGDRLVCTRDSSVAVDLSTARPPA